MNSVFPLYNNISLRFLSTYRWQLQLIRNNKHRLSLLPFLVYIDFLMHMRVYAYFKGWEEKKKIA